MCFMYLAILQQLVTLDCCLHCCCFYRCFLCPMPCGLPWNLQPVFLAWHGFLQWSHHNLSFFFWLVKIGMYIITRKSTLEYTRCIRRVPKRSPQKWGHKKPRIKISKISKISIVDFLKIWGNIGGNLDKNMMRRKLMKIHKNIDFF